MSRFRKQKNYFSSLCGEVDWRAGLEAALIDAEAARAALNPLLALLPRPEMRYQAAFGLGLAVPLIAQSTMEDARVFMRRLMWSLNEESGNLGWGVPEAMGCILARSPALAGEYGRIFLSYGYETGKDDNFLDHAPLRKGVYWGMGVLARANQPAARPALPHLTRALRDDHGPIRLASAWALLQLARHTPDSEFADAAEAAHWLAAADALGKCSVESPDVDEEIFDGDAIRPLRLSATAQTAEQTIREKLARK